MNREEEIEGIRAIGAPVLTPAGNVLGSVSISGPAHRMRIPEYEEQMTAAITDTANRIQVNINAENTNSELPAYDD